MERYPLMYEGTAVGELTAETSGLYVRFCAQGQLPDDGLWCAWAVGESGQLRLGVLEPWEEGARLHRRLSGREASAPGRLVRGELRPASERTLPVWKLTETPERLVSTPWISRALKGRTGVYVRQEGTLRYVAIPWGRGEPFPLTPLFCLASVRLVEGRQRVVYCFDAGERPVVL